MKTFRLSQPQISVDGLDKKIDRLEVLSYKFILEWESGRPLDSS